jgi:hypothetical protein
MIPTAQNVKWKEDSQVGGISTNEAYLVRDCQHAHYWEQGSKQGNAGGSNGVFSRIMEAAMCSD